MARLVVILTCVTVLGIGSTVQASSQPIDVATIPPGSQVMNARFSGWGPDDERVQLLMTAWDDGTGNPQIVVARDEIFYVDNAEYFRAVGSDVSLSVSEDISTANLSASVPGLGRLVVSMSSPPSAATAPSQRGCGAIGMFGNYLAHFDSPSRQLSADESEIYDPNFHVDWSQTPMQLVRATASLDGVPLDFARCRIFGRDAFGSVLKFPAA